MSSRLIDYVADINRKEPIFPSTAEGLLRCLEKEGPGMLLPKGKIIPPLLSDLVAGALDIMDYQRESAVLGVIAKILLYLCKADSVFASHIFRTEKQKALGTLVRVMKVSECGQLARALCGCLFGCSFSIAIFFCAVFPVGGRAHSPHSANYFHHLRLCEEGNDPAMF